MAYGTDIDPIKADCKRRGDPRIGMSVGQAEASFGVSLTANRSESAELTFEQYVHSNKNGFVYLRNGRGHFDSRQLPPEVNLTTLMLPRAAFDSRSFTAFVLYFFDRSKDLLTLALYPSGPRRDPRGLPAMEYKEFVIRAFEREPGKWRASVQRADGRPLLARKGTRVFVTGTDAKTAEAATRLALTAIDRGAFSRKLVFD